MEAKLFSNADIHVFEKARTGSNDKCKKLCSEMV